MPTPSLLLYSLATCACGAEGSQTIIRGDSDSEVLDWTEDAILPDHWIWSFDDNRKPVPKCSQCRLARMSAELDEFRLLLDNQKCAQTGFVPASLVRDHAKPCLRCGRDIAGHRNGWCVSDVADGC
jgi:hypothetical protein